MFRQTDIEEVKKTFQSLDPKKAAQMDDIKTNLLNQSIKKCRRFCKIHM